MSVDPLAEGYEWQSVFAFGSNQPVHAKEIEGLESGDDKSLNNRSWSLSDFGNGMVDGLKGLGQGLVEMNTYSQLKQGVEQIGSVIDAYNEGGLGAAVEQYGETVYERSGLKGIIDTGSDALSGDAYAQGQGTIMLATLVIKVPAKKGVIYKVPAEATKTNKPYVGRTKKSDPSQRGGKNDGRDRSKAEVIDEYDPADPVEGSYKEQKAINENGGVENLDNKRNEMSTERFNNAKKKYGE